MQNVTMKVEGKLLQITVDLSAQGEPSASGKSVIIASTQGNANVQGGFKVGLNVYRPRTVAQ